MARSKGPNKGGRPTRYRTSNADKAYTLCCNHGYTDAQLADALDVAVRTVQYWKKKHPEFFHSIRRGKDEFDYEHVESALLKRAKGFVRKKVTKRTRKLGKGENAIIEEVTCDTVEEVAGSVRAQETWLFNRNPERWKRVPKETGDTGEKGKTGVLIAPAQEDFETWLRSLGIDPNSTSDGNHTPEDKSSS